MKLVIELIKDEIRCLEGQVESSYNTETDHKYQYENITVYHRSIRSPYNSDRYYQEREALQSKIDELQSSLETTEGLG